MGRKTDYRSRIYNSYYSSHWKHFHSVDRREYELIAKVSRKKWRFLLPGNKGARIIDIACGGGHFLYFLQKEGYTNTQGIDISPQMAVFARTMSIANVTEANLFSYLPKHKNEFDFIVANDVIEHLKKDEVLRFLDLIHGALRPGGRMFISTCNSQSAFGSFVRYIDFTHEVSFNSVSLGQILRVTGFERVRIFADKPVAHDIRSAIRTALWNILDKVFRFYFVIARGTGRGLRKYQDIFTPGIFAVGDKPIEKPQKKKSQ